MLLGILILALWILVFKIYDRFVDNFEEYL